MSDLITESRLLAAGYKKYPVHLGKEDADLFYQKRAKEPGGKVKYSINVYHYDMSSIYPTDPHGYDVEARFLRSDGNPFTVLDNGDRLIEDHELFFEEIWSSVPSTTYFEAD